MPDLCFFYALHFTCGLTEYLTFHTLYVASLTTLLLTKELTDDCGYRGFPDFNLVEGTRLFLVSRKE